MNIKKNLYLLIITFIISCSPATQSNEDVAPDGYKMLLMGNSFFRPYADHLNTLASQANLNEHISTVVNRGGENGRPINLWNDSTTEEHQLIKSTLNQGNIEIFGMTSGYDFDSDNPTEGHSAWIQYALQNNPNIIIFIAIGSFDFPNGDSNSTRPDWNTFASDNGFDSIQEFYDYYINEMIHKEIVDELRKEFPSTKIFTIPTGWATKNLAQMNLDNELLDDITMVGPKSTSIFTDEKGHQGQIVIETGTMIWLNSIYQINLEDFDYDTGFNTDLHQIAIDVMNNHPSSYKFNNE
tara:strand:- start:74 stop:961 length:888 start_codon:yes stop_codon:yes gene_type:complete